MEICTDFAGSIQYWLREMRAADGIMITITKYNENKTT